MRVYVCVCHLQCVCQHVSTPARNACACVCVCVCQLHEQTNRLIVISAIDNLVKGAAGQAVQNMNIMLGFDETAGLQTIPFPL